MDDSGETKNYLQKQVGLYMQGDQIGRIFAYWVTL
jgi:hypothetical protein